MRGSTSLAEQSRWAVIGGVTNAAVNDEVSRSVTSGGRGGY